MARMATGPSRRVVPPPSEQSRLTPLHADMLRRLQRNSFGYFTHEINPENGLVLDKTTTDWPASIAAMGMALTAYPVGVARRFRAAS